MVGSKSVRNKRTVRTARTKNRRGARSSKSSSVSSLPSSGLRGYSVMRSFSLYPKQWTADSKPIVSWLDSLSDNGAIPMKIFSVNIPTTNKNVSNWAITGVVQTLIFGAEDLAYSSPIKEDKVTSCKYFKGFGGVSLTAPALGYAQGKVSQLNVKVTCGSELSKRAGRIAVALVPLSYDDAVNYRSLNLRQTPSFEELLHMPGVVCAPTSTPLSKRFSFRKLDFGSELQAMGKVDFLDVSSSGGLPTVAVYIGYQDMASTTPDPGLLYAPEEALLNVDLTGRIHVREASLVYIRRNVITAPTSSVTCRVGGETFEVPSDKFCMVDGSLTIPKSALDLRMSRFIDIVSLEGNSCTMTPFTEASLQAMEEDLEDGEVINHI